MTEDSKEKEGLELLPIEEEKRRDKDPGFTPYGLMDRDTAGEGSQWRPQGFQSSSLVEMQDTRRAMGVGAAQLLASRAAPVQRMERRSASPSSVMRAAAVGVEGVPQALPHLERIQASFGQHDLGQVRAFVGGRAREANDQMGAVAYATGDAIAFRDAPDLYTAAHEAAHIIQQRGTVRLQDGVSRVGDEHEQHADAVAARVLRGQSAEDLLNRYARPGAASRGAASVQQLAQGKDYKTSGRVQEAMEALQKALQDAQKARSAKAGDHQGESQGRGRIKQAMSKDPAETLRQAVSELSRLKESGSEDELNAAVDAILKGAGGDASAAQEAPEGRDMLNSTAPPVQKMAAAGGPASASPPAWAVAAGAALMSVGVASHSMARGSNTSNVSDNLGAREKAQKHRQEQQPSTKHKGSIQIKGKEIKEVSPFPWGRDKPMTKADAVAGLEKLAGQIPREQRQAAEQAIARAKAFIESTNVEATGAISRSFQDDKGQIHISIEVSAGRAFA